MPVVASMLPGVFGKGKYLSKSNDVGFRRPVGIVFPANGVADPVKLGHAVGPVTVPPHGSITCCLIAERSPLLSAAVGTVVVNGVAVLKRNASQLKNQNVLSRPS